MIQAVIEKCAGIDVGKTFVVVCVMTGAAAAEPRVETRRFGTFNGELDHLRALANLGLQNLAGAIVGRALYEGRFTVAEAQVALEG